jgi:phospholipase C
VSGTSAGHGTNDAGFGKHALPQLSIFEQLTQLNISWTNYATSAGGGDALYFNWTETSGAAKTNIKTLDEFFQDAYLGRLPQFTYVNPSCCGVGTNSMHPTGLISDGEVLLKQLYDSLRNGPQWTNTLFIVTFDETGGFHDHVPPPLAPRPDNLTYTESTPDGGSYTFEFDRLGGRLPTWIISPWVESGHVEKLGTNSAGQQVSYSATSILRTLGYLWDFQPFNPRVEWSPSFDHLIQTRVNTNTPLVMPNPKTF